VQDFARHNEIRCTFRLDGSEPALSDDCATAVFRIVQEALTNVSRHARASYVDVILRHHHRFELEVRDNGIGFDVARASRGGSYGVQGMQERARMIGAQFNVVSEAGAGSTVWLAFDQALDSGRCAGTDYPASESREEGM
jgi:signal transduction histidine kinase